MRPPEWLPGLRPARLVEIATKHHAKSGDLIRKSDLLAYAPVMEDGWSAVEVSVLRVKLKSPRGSAYEAYEDEEIFKAYDGGVIAFETPASELVRWFSPRVVLGLVFPLKFEFPASAKLWLTLMLRYDFGEIDERAQS